MDVMLKVKFALSSKSKNQLGDVYIYLNQKVITAINSLDGSTLGGNLIMSYQVDYMSSVFIPAKGIENRAFFTYYHNISLVTPCA